MARQTVQPVGSTASGHTQQESYSESYRDPWLIDDQGKAKQVVLCGYYGFDNLGDELICKSLCYWLKDQGVEVTVLSQNPLHTARAFEVHAVDRRNPIKVFQAISHADLFISGGGGLFSRCIWA